MSEIARSPSGVAIGVSGEAQTSEQEKSRCQRQRPSLQMTVRPPAKMVHWAVAHTVPEAKEHTVPSFGSALGQGAAASAGGGRHEAACPALEQPQVHPASRPLL